MEVNAKVREIERKERPKVRARHTQRDRARQGEKKGRKRKCWKETKIEGEKRETHR